MKNRLIILIGSVFFVFAKGFCQAQTCPVNINFAMDNLTHWEAYTGNNANGNNDQSRHPYDSTKTAPTGTINVSAIAEYQLPSVLGIQVLTAQGTDAFGGFQKIPTINGYSYNYSILLGSTSISRSSNGTDAGGYVRGVSYQISVPTSAVTEPYTMTYAYAMVLENGRHPSNFQPLFSATLTLANGSVIACASPKYFLPTVPGTTQNNGNGELDSAVAIADGFTVSRKLSPNPDPNAPSNDPDPPHLQDVWTKGWTEVTFDLSPYRGQKVTLTFEADNCVPGGHFAYAYVALRNTCAGLQISGPQVACSSGSFTYSVPALAGATYNWQVPSGWSIVSGATTNIINVQAGATGGPVVAFEQNDCANLKDTMQVTTSPPTMPGTVSGDAEVCALANTNKITLSGNRGNVVNWISSSNGVNWAPIPDSTTSYTYTNLNVTTLFAAVVQNGGTCALDTSSVATVMVDQRSAGGQVNPPIANFCANQTVADVLTLKNFNGQVNNWQSSPDSVAWQDFAPVYHDTTYDVLNVTANTYYRAIVHNGVCPADTSAVASVKLFTTPFPQSTYSPSDTTICFGASAPLSALIKIGTDYTWASADSLQNPGNGHVAGNPFQLVSVAVPDSSAQYVLSIENQGCPNLLKDTFHIAVIPPIIVSPGNDTAVVVGEPLQFNAFSNDTTQDIFTWNPATDLNSANIPNPVGTYGSNIDTITYIVKATDAYGCFGQNKISVRVFKTSPDIFVPNAFTPGLGINNIFRPIPVGISTMRYFRVYNRWGQLVYSTSSAGQGWDGTVEGKPQDSGTYVWMVQGVDYTGKVITKKGTMVLIR